MTALLDHIDRIIEWRSNYKFAIKHGDFDLDAELRTLREEIGVLEAQLEGVLAACEIHRETARDAESALAAEREKHRWIYDKPTGEGEYNVLYQKGKKKYPGMEHWNGYYWDEFHTGGKVGIIAYQPLPPPPEEEGDGKRG